MSQIYMGDNYDFDYDYDYGNNTSVQPKNEISLLEIPIAFVFDNTILAIKKCYNCIVPPKKIKKE